VPVLSSGRQSLTVVETIAEVRQLVQSARAGGARIGLVPTMGALHAGHVSLIEAARRECDYVVVTIFVNPTQFGPHEDFQKYPRDLETDSRLCVQAGAAAIFHPPTSQVYPPGFTSFVEVAGLSDVLEGKFRPGHFRGVATVVLKLFQMVPADCAYFGQKDYQQQTIIRRMCADFDLPIEIRICPTIREPDGLALSSRNVYLNPQERQSALALSRSLELGRQLLESGETDPGVVRGKMLDLLNATPLVRPDYVTLIHPETLAEAAGVLPKLVAVVAARVGSTRLIDNLIIDCEHAASGNGPAAF
jgi:pantoate--beta-alanine ligase